jgi:hypothetical protein
MAVLRGRAAGFGGRRAALLERIHSATYDFHQEHVPVRAASGRMPSEVLQRWATELLRELAAGGGCPAAARAAVEAGGLACLVQVWPAGSTMPTAAAGAPPRGTRRARCREDVVAAVERAGRPLTRKEVVRALKGSGRAGHGGGTVEKALADLTRAGRLVNTRDKKGYRLPGWVRPGPTLFDDAQGPRAGG